MPAIKSLLITLVEDKHSAQYIADIFNIKELAKVSRILLLPYSVIMKVENMRGSMAFIDIEEWYDTEAAWDLIRDLNDSDISVKTVHYSYETSWSVARNPNLLIPNRQCYQSYVTNFENNDRSNLDYGSLEEYHAYQESRPRGSIENLLNYDRDAPIVIDIMNYDDQEDYIPFGEYNDYDSTLPCM